MRRSINKINKKQTNIYGSLLHGAGFPLIIKNSLIFSFFLRHKKHSYPTADVESVNANNYIFIEHLHFYFNVCELVDAGGRVV
jgi:hypothetical protein